MIAVLAVAVAALVVPLIGSRTQAAGGGDAKTVAAARAAAAATVTAPVAATSQKGVRAANGQEGYPVSDNGAEFSGAISENVRQTLGLRHVANAKAASKKIAQHIMAGGRPGGGQLQPQAGEPEVLAGNAAFSAAVITTIGGRDNQFSEVALLADWDGREDDVADRAKKVDDFSGVEPEIDFSLTRAAISEHTIANGFAENIFYYGDSVGNVWVGADTTGD